MKTEKNVTLKGRFLGVVFLVVVQLINGFIHTYFGFALLLGSIVPVASSTNSPVIFSSYTLIYGLLTIFFTYLFWRGKRLGWIGIVTISLFVIIADTLTLFNLLTFLGIIKIAAIGEIPYSLIILIYLIQNHIRSKYEIRAKA